MIAQNFQLSISSFKQSASLRTFPFSYVAGGHIRSALWVSWPEDQIPKVFVSWHCTGNPRGSLCPRVPVFAIGASDRPSIRMRGHCIPLRAAASLRSGLRPDLLGCSTHRASAYRYSAVLHELWMGVHHPPLIRAPRAHAVPFSAV